MDQDHVNLWAFVDVDERTYEVKSSFQVVSERELDKMCSFWDVNSQPILDSDIN